MLRLWDRVDFEFQKNDHTAAELLLYPQGNQIFTRTADHNYLHRAGGLGRRGVGDQGRRGAVRP